MATLEEARAAVAKRFSKYQITRPTRVAYLGDGRGFSSSNIYVEGEPGYLWAREHQDGGKPFKILNRQTNLNVAFNMPVRIGYPDDQPQTEQILGISFGGISPTAAGTSAIGGVGAHHTQHEWGGGDEVYIDQRQILPGLVKPQTPASMRVEINPIHHHAKGGWKMFDGETTKELTEYLPASNYRYLLITLNPLTNSISYHPGNVFTPDLSIDSIISNSAKTTFRHIPAPPADEMPLAAILLEPDTTTIDWNLNGVNNLAPMRLMFGTPEQDILDRLEALERRTGLGTLPQTGANNAQNINTLPGVIDGINNRIVLQRNETLPTLLVGELGYDINADEWRYGTETAGNQLLAGGGGGGGVGALSALEDVSINSSALAANNILSYSSANKWENNNDINISQLVVGDGFRLFDGNHGDALESYYDYFEHGAPFVFKDDNFVDLMRIGGPSGADNYIEISPDSDNTHKFFFYRNGNPLLTLDGDTGSTGSGMQISNETDYGGVTIMGRPVVVRDTGTVAAGLVLQQKGTTDNNGILQGMNTSTTGTGSTENYSMLRYMTTFTDHRHSTAECEWDVNQKVITGAYWDMLSTRRTATTSTMNVIVNVNGNDTDFRVYPNGAAHGSDSPHIFADASLGQIGLGAGASRMRVLNGVQIGAPTGGDNGVGTLNTAGDIYKNNSAYTNPDYALEHYYTGEIVVHADKDGAKEYKGLLPLNKLGEYMKEHYHLPGRSNEPMGVFERSDWLQEKVEEQALYIVQLHDRIERLEKTLSHLINGDF